MADTYYPPVSFYFEVKVLGTSRSPWTSTEVDASFQEVSGVDRELEVQSLAEGGENRFTHQLPKRGKHPNLVLKRGLVTQKSSLADWAEKTIAADFSTPVEPRTLQVTLLGQEARPLVVWTFNNAYPVKWTTAGFNSTENKIVVETLEMAYAYAERQVQGS
jgi:phage tail-like protein